MDINKAISHFKWRFENGWKPTKRDIEAYNAIIEYKEMQNSLSLSENESLAKLWIHQLMLLNNTQMYSAERAIQVIDEILQQSVYDWSKKLHSQANIMRFASLLGSEEYKDVLNKLNFTKLKEIGSKLTTENSLEFEKAMKADVKEENVIKFVEQQIDRIINKFEK